MKTIHKQKLGNAFEQVIKLPKGAIILCVHTQGCDVCIWYECEIGPNLEMEEHTISCFGTGFEMPLTPMKYLGTVFFLGGDLVYHFYELVK